MMALRVALRSTLSSPFSRVSARQMTTYKSDYNPATLYPDTSEQLSIPTSPSSSSDETWNGFIPHDKMEVKYMHSNGPGGQNVNKVLTRAIVRFGVTDADWIPEKVRAKFIEKFRHRITKHGQMTIESQRTRYQKLNLADCYDKLRQTLYECAEEVEKENTQPSHETIDLRAKKLEFAARKRLREKRIEAQKRQSRDDF